MVHPWILFSLSLAAALQAGAPHYDVTLTVDAESHLLRGHESIRFDQNGSTMRWDKQALLQLHESHFPDGNLKMTDTSVDAATTRKGRHVMDFEYTASATRGFRWLTKEPGLFTAFWCTAWMVCASSPDQQATLRLEIIVKDPALTAVGPGVLRRQWRDVEGAHWVFETPTPVQTYLWSFAVAPLQHSKLAEFEIFAPVPDHSASLKRTAEAATFFRERTGVDAIPNGYRQVFMPQPGLFGQEATGLALMTEAALQNLEAGDVVLMAHELAHQWWGVSVGIDSWSDFWLNEGVAEYASLLFLEHASGKTRFESEIANLRSRFADLQASGKDRPLHFESWKDASDALGDLPYVKGALFLHRLRTQIGDAQFWKGMALYSRRNRGKLVDSHSFQRAFEEATKLDLDRLFRKEVFGK